MTKTSDKPGRRFVHAPISFEATTRNTKPTTTNDPSFPVASLRKSACGLSDDFLPALALVCLAFSRMSLSNTIPGSHGVMKVVTRAELQNSGAWKRAFENRCKDHRYYEIVDETLQNDFEHYYVRLEDASGNVRAIQPVFFVQQNLVEAVAGKIRSVVDLIRKIFPHFLTMRVLMVGCAAGTGDLGACDERDEAWTADALRGSLRTYAGRNKASLVVLKDFPANYRSSLETFALNGYARIPSMPMTRLSLRYANWDEYFRTLSKATRKDLSRKFRKAGRAAKIEMKVVSEIAPFIDEIYPLYLAVHERSPLQFETLTKDYFRAIAQRMPERARFFIWRQSGKVVAFSFCLVCSDAIYDECIGLDYSVALDLHLYFYTLRDIISWALQQGLKYYYSNPLNYEPKLHLDCELVPLDLYVRHTSGLLNPIFRRVIKFLGPTRHDPVLRRFPNADEL
jgi:predicted N-acyltransferase